MVLVYTRMVVVLVDIRLVVLVDTRMVVVLVDTRMVDIEILIIGQDVASKVSPAIFSRKVEIWVVLNL